MYNHAQTQGRKQNVTGHPFPRTKPLSRRAVPGARVLSHITATQPCMCLWRGMPQLCTKILIAAARSQSGYRKR